MTGDDYCNSLRARYFELQTMAQQARFSGEHHLKIRKIDAQLAEVLNSLNKCGGLYPARPTAAIKASSPGQATPVPPTSYVGQGSQKQQPAFGMAAAQKKPPAFGGAGFRQY